MSQGWRYWVRFCDVYRRPYCLEDVDERGRRASWWVSEFVVWMVGVSRAGGDSIVGYVKGMLQNHGEVWNTAPWIRSPVYKLFLERVGRAVPASKRLIRHPLPLAVAVELVADEAQPLEYRLAVALGFRGLLRGGELFTDSASPELHVLRAVDVQVDGDVLVLQVQADKSHGRRRVGVDTCNDVFPTRELLEAMYECHFDLGLPVASPLLVSREGEVPSLSSFCTWLARVSLARGVAHILPHSLRIGGAVSLAAAGVSAVLLQAIGGWSSQAWMTYVHPHISAAVRLADKLQQQLAALSSFPDDVAEVCGTVAPRSLCVSPAPSSPRDSAAVVRPQASFVQLMAANYARSMAQSAKGGAPKHPMSPAVSLAALSTSE